VGDADLCKATSMIMPSHSPGIDIDSCKCSCISRSNKYISYTSDFKTKKVRLLKTTCNRKTAPLPRKNLEARSKLKIFTVVHQYDLTHRENRREIKKI
jgi:hypothetical protein